MFVQSKQCCDESDRHHVGLTAGDALDDFLQRHRDQPRSAGPDELRHLRVRFLVNDQAVAVERQFGCEAPYVEPVHCQQDVKPVARPFDRMRRQPDEGSRLTAPDLRPRRATHDAEKSGRGRCTQQQFARSHDARTTGPGDGDRQYAEGVRRDVPGLFCGSQGNPAHRQSAAAMYSGSDIFTATVEDRVLSLPSAVRALT